MKKIKKWHIAGFIISIVLGVLLHFLYEWSNNNKYVAIFGPVNESLWEHCKLLFWPIFIYSIFEYFCIGKRYKNYLYAKMVSLYIGVFAIISLFYTYSGIIGQHYFVADMIIFVVSIFISQYLSYRIIVSHKEMDRFFSFLLIIFLLLCFILFTYYPPEIQLFKDLKTGQYGINK